MNSGIAPAAAGAAPKVAIVSTNELFLTFRFCTGRSRKILYDIVLPAANTSGDNINQFDVQILFVDDLFVQFNWAPQHQFYFDHRN